MNTKFVLKDFNGREISPSGYKLSNGEIIKFFINNPSWLIFLFHWRRTLSRKNDINSFDIETPWYNYGAINWVKKNIKSHMRVFEYGSGGSTLYYAKHVKEIISVEHNEKWFEEVKKRTSRYHNVDIVLQEPDILEKNENCNFLSYTFKEYQGLNFERYVRIIENYPDDYFDLIVIDGRCRHMCLEFSMKKVKKGGWIIFDNSERLNNYNAIQKYNYLKLVFFYGFGPFLNFFWYTTIIGVSHANF
jgi:hypothetical protein